MPRIIYSSQRVGFLPGEMYQNPRFFDGKPYKGATSIIVVGDWPKVVETYRNANIPVEVIEADKRGQPIGFRTKQDDPESSTPATYPSSAPPIEDLELPQHLENCGIKRLRSIVEAIDPDKDVANKEEAIDYIRGYVLHMGGSLEGADD